MASVSTEKRSDVPAWQNLAGGWRSALNPAWDFSGVQDLLTAEKESADAVLLQQGRERVVKVPCACSDGNACDVVVKTYRSPGRLREFFDGKEKGSKAFRAFRAAWILQQNGVGTPAPIAVAERRDGNGHLLESRLITEFVPAMSNFRDELFRIYAKNPDCEVLMSLMQAAADACRAMHDCGIIHRDLGNQNIAMKKTDAGAWSVLLIDLDRVRIFPAGTLTDEQRGRDLARLALPSDFRRVFFMMYFGGRVPPKAFSAGEENARKSFRLHSRLRPVRHPFREFKIWRQSAEMLREMKCSPLGGGRELWIWDKRSAQPIPAYRSKDRRKYHSLFNIYAPVKELLLRGFSLKKRLRENVAGSFCRAVDFDGTFGFAFEVFPESWERHSEWLYKLEDLAGGVKLPVLLRVYAHCGETHWRYVSEKARELFSRGNSVSIAFLQDREAIREVSKWEKMVRLVLEKTSDFIDFYEVGHAINRTKWGVWDFREYVKLLAVFEDAKKRNPRLNFVGPACIDFDLHSLPALLSCLPANLFSALSQHLYVDRRGAPENFQGKFDTVGKCAMLRAFSQEYALPAEKIIISEVNWPLLNTGDWSPVGSPYTVSGPSASPPSATEEDYAKYLCRYWLLTIASGHVSRVYWWQLVHRGFGLVDDSTPDAVRPREAFYALGRLLNALRGASFEKVRESVAGTWALQFVRKNGTRFLAKWTLNSNIEIEEIGQ